MKLFYLYGDPSLSQRFVPGWPADDHDEPDAKLAQQKLDSGLYGKTRHRLPEHEQYLRSGLYDEPEPEAPKAKQHSAPKAEKHEQAPEAASEAAEVGGGAAPAPEPAAPHWGFTEPEGA